MNKFIRYISVLAFGLLTTQCDDYLSTSSPENTDDEFVTSTTSETFKILSRCYALYRQECIMGVYLWNDPISSDAEYYPEEGSSNNLNARLQSEQYSADVMSSQFNYLYSIISTTSKVAEIISGKSEFKEAASSNKVNDWTQLYGEALTFRAFCYFQLVRHYGDVPYGYENTNVTEYELSSRFDIYDKLIASLEEAEGYMYKIGDSGITAERFTRTFADALIGQIALFSAGYQTIRTDMPDLYGDVQFTSKGTEEYNCKYARRTDYVDYYKIAEKYLQLAIDNKGTSGLITTDERSYANNPFQRNFQYIADLQVSPESLLEIGSIQGGGSNAINSEYGYGFVRPSDGGGSNAAPCKGFGAIRIMPTVYYGEFEQGDKRRDASVAVTGSAGDGNEKILSFTPGNKTNGGLSTNKWDENRMNPPYTVKQRQSGMNWVVLRMADVILMQAETKAELGSTNEALSLVNQIRQRAFGDSNHNITATGDALKEAIWQERKLEFLGEGVRRWDLVRSGKYAEETITTRAAMTAMISDLKSQGYHQFANGNVISNYIYTKMVKLDNPLTYDADESNPALYPGWRGQYDYSSIESIKSKVSGTNHNMAIQGLFNYIDPNGDEAKALESDGYTKTNWAVNLTAKEAHYVNTNFLPGITSKDTPPRYFWPLPSEIIIKSNGTVSNGYGLKQE